MKRNGMYEWQCASCGEVLWGKGRDDNFVSEMELTKPRKYQAVGCPYCGSMCGFRVRTFDDFLEENNVTEF